MENGGWIKLHRKFLNWEWSDSPEMVGLFVHLLLEANHEERKWHGQTILRGQVLTSRDRLAKLTGLSVQQVRTCLNRMEQTGEISRKTTNKFTLVTVSNYDRYQVNDEVEQPTNNQQPTINQPTNNQQITTNKNIKNERNNITLSNGGWRFLSSVQKSVCGFDKDRMAEMKRDLFRAEVERLAGQLEMPTEQVEDFVRYYTEHTPGSDTIRAETYDPFNVRDRMVSWMKREKPKVVARQEKGQGRVDRTIEAFNEVEDWIHGRFSSTTGDGDADNQFGR